MCQGFDGPVELLGGHIATSRSPQLTHSEKNENKPEVGVNQAKNDEEVDQVMSLRPSISVVDWFFAW